MILKPTVIQASLHDAVGSDGVEYEPKSGMNDWSLILQFPHKQWRGTAPSLYSGIKYQLMLGDVIQLRNTTCILIIRYYSTAICMHV